MWEEAELASCRINERMASEATVLQGAVASLLSKEGGTFFRKLIDELLGK